MRLRITTYAISRTFDMTSCPGQPQLATRCQLLLFRTVVDTPRCLPGRIQALKARTLGIAGISGTKRSWLCYHRDTYYHSVLHFTAQMCLHWRDGNNTIKIYYCVFCFIQKILTPALSCFTFTFMASFMPSSSLPRLWPEKKSRNK